MLECRVVNGEYRDKTINMRHGCFVTTTGPMSDSNNSEVKIETANVLLVMSPVETVMLMSRLMDALRQTDAYKADPDGVLAEAIASMV